MKNIELLKQLYYGRHLSKKESELKSVSILTEQLKSRYSGTDLCDSDY